MDSVSRPLVSVVVPTYNRRSSLQRLLEALGRQTYPSQCLEVVVVDDGSTDGTLDFARQLHPGFALRVLEQPHGGPAAARNRGVAAAQGSLILFLDDDVAPAPELVQEHVDSHTSEPNAVVIGPMSPPAAWPRPIWVRWEEEQLQAQYRAMLAGVWSCTARQFYTGNASLARAQFIEAKGFDTSFQRAEDVELGYRLDENGARFIFNARADVLHYAWRSFDSWCRTPYQYGRYDVIMQRDKGRHTLDWASREFHGRKNINRALVSVCAGRGRTGRAVVGGLRALVRVAAGVGAQRTAQNALSAIFGVLYWQGVCDEMGDRRMLWRTIAAAAPEV
ncbi:MAG: glycosyltransferase [Chloroflexota bacterium]|nr:glycosyltransferase [Chloroflexota bacterium]